MAMEKEGVELQEEEEAMEGFKFSPITLEPTERGRRDGEKNPQTDRQKHRQRERERERERETMAMEAGVEVKLLWR